MKGGEKTSRSLNPGRDELADELGWEFNRSYTLHRLNSLVVFPSHFYNLWKYNQQSK